MVIIWRGRFAYRGRFLDWASGTVIDATGTNQTETLDLSGLNVPDGRIVMRVGLALLVMAALMWANKRVGSWFDAAPERTQARAPSPAHRDRGGSRRSPTGDHGPGSSANPVKRASAVWMERLGSLRMALPVLGPGSGEAARLEELEVLSLDIEGKRMLWRVLDTLASSDGRLVGFDFAGLEPRAESQRRRLEPFRLELAAAAFAPDCRQEAVQPAALNALVGRSGGHRADLRTKGSAMSLARCQDGAMALFKRHVGLA
jgi:hypothetical protein